MKNKIQNTDLLSPYSVCRHRTLSWILMTLLFLTVMGCTEQRFSVNQPRPLKVGDTTITVSIAADNYTRRVGYMHVTEIPEDEGKLFIFPYASFQSFWMKNCPSSIDIAYIKDDFRIAKLYTMAVEKSLPKPDSQYKRYPSEAQVKYVLEVRGGFFARHGVREGDIIDLTESLKNTLVK